MTKNRTRYEKASDDLANYKLSQYRELAATIKARHPLVFTALLSALRLEAQEQEKPRTEARH